MKICEKVHLLLQTVVSLKQYGYFQPLLPPVPKLPPDYPETDERIR